MTKADYVRRATQTRDHVCHWPGCNKQVPPAKWGCAKHWFALPKKLRTRIWQAYVSGQELTQTPSAAYIAAARDVEAWIANNVTASQGKLL